MLTFLKKLFGAKPADDIDPDLEIEESWQTNFHKNSTARFTEETGEAYSTKLTHDGLVLSFGKKNVYAWTVDPLYRYRDFVVEGLIEFPEPGKDEAAGETGTGADGESTRAGSMAAGLLFRYLTEATFYSVLVSDRGMVRMDVVINGTPVPVLGWTETKAGSRETGAGKGNDAETEEETDHAPYQENPRVFSLRLIARGTSFTIIVNDEWVAECSDDTIQAAGKIAFAAQNWKAPEGTAVTLRGIAIDSGYMDVETIYARWNQYLAIPADAHVALARTWYAMGKYVPAIVELNRAWKLREGDAGELLVSARAYLAQHLYTEAERQIRKALELDPLHVEATAELGGIFYLQNRFEELEGLLHGLLRESVEKSPFLSNLEGHLLRWHGRHEESAAAYSRAAAVAQDQGLFALHAGNEYTDAGKPTEALDAWLDAARVFLSENEYDDLGETVDRLLSAAPEDVRVLGIAGKYYYGIENETKAFPYLERASELDTDDSAVWYLLGMILSARGNTEKAIKAFRKAAALESEYGLYHFRLAETLYNAGEECDAEIARAIETGGDNGWVWNLAALKALDDDDVEGADGFIGKARRLLPAELTILTNYAEIMRLKGRLDEALALFDPDDADALWASANLLVEDGRNEEAEDRYVQAQRRKPFDAKLLTDRAANCLELDLLNEADDLLGKAIDIESSPRIFRLISYLSGRKGEYARAEISLKRGLEEFPNDGELLYELASVYNATGKRQKAADVVGRLLEIDDSERVRELEDEIRDAATFRIDCSTCARHWRVPKDIPAQGSLRLTAEPPDDLPAGTCPVCQTHYCIGCAKETLGEDGRFRCKKCGQPLKLVNQGIIWLLNQWQEGAVDADSSRSR